MGSGHQRGKTNPPVSASSATTSWSAILSSGEIDAYNPTGRFKGMLTDSNGKPLKIPGLRTIHFGTGLGASGPKIALLFTADQKNDGLYGTITPVS